MPSLLSACLWHAVQTVFNVTLVTWVEEEKKRNGRKRVGTDLERQGCFTKRSKAPVYRGTWVMAYIVEQRKNPYPVQMVYRCVAHLNCYEIHYVMWKYLKPFRM